MIPLPPPPELQYFELRRRLSKERVKVFRIQRSYISFNFKRDSFRSCGRVNASASTRSCRISGEFHVFRNPKSFVWHWAWKILTHVQCNLCFGLHLDIWTSFNVLGLARAKTAIRDSEKDEDRFHPKVPYMTSSADSELYRLRPRRIRSCTDCELGR